MANNYLQYSEVIEDLTDEEIKFLETCFNWEPPLDAEGELPDGFEYPGWYDPQAEGVGFDYDLKKMDRSIYFISEEYGNLDTLGSLVHELILKFRPNAIFKLTYAETCSKMRLGEFSGGAMVVSKYGVEYMNAADWATRLVNEIHQKIKKEKEQ